MKNLIKFSKTLKVLVVEDDNFKEKIDEKY